MHRTFLEIMKPPRKETPLTFSQIFKYNPYHDKRGRFSGKSGFSSANSGMGPYQIFYSPDKKKVALAAAGAVSYAQKEEKQLTDDLKAVAAASGGKMYGLEYAVKTEDSLKRKLVTECKEMKTDPQTAVKRMYDINRYTVHASPGKLTESANKTLAGMQEKGYTVERIKNTMANTKAPYRGVNTVLKAPDGTRFELQFHTPQSQKIKDVNHKLYAEQREDKTAPKRKLELDRIMRDNLKSLVVPKGIETIQNVDYLKEG